MANKISIFYSSDFVTSAWSGGETTQLYISPKSANYKALDFQIRLSSATVTIEESTFSKLPEVDRKLMILEGKIMLSHEGMPPKELSAFVDVASFKGDWKTSAKGTCTDFNVMTKGNLKSKLWSAHLEENQTLFLEENSGDLFIYLFKGSLRLSTQNESYSLITNQLIAIEDCENCKLTIKATEKSRLIFVKIK